MLVLSEIMVAPTAMALTVGAGHAQPGSGMPEPYRRLSAWLTDCAGWLFELLNELGRMIWRRSPE